jgi:hypothetical protein
MTMILRWVSALSRGVQAASAPDWTTEIDIVVAGHRASDGADGATDQCSGERTAAGKGGYPGACSGPDQAARCGAVARAIATIGKSESEASQDERRRNTARQWRQLSVVG